MGVGLVSLGDGSCSLSEKVVDSSLRGSSTPGTLRLMIAQPQLCGLSVAETSLKRETKPNRTETEVLACLTV